MLIRDTWIEQNKSSRVHPASTPGSSGQLLENSQTLQNQSSENAGDFLSLLYKNNRESSRKRKSAKRNIHSITVLIKKHCSSCGQPDPIPAEASRKAMLFSENSIANKKRTNDWRITSGLQLPIEAAESSSPFDKFTVPNESDLVKLKNENPEYYQKKGYIKR